MAENNRPNGRQRNVTGQGTGGYRRGEGLGTGPVGNQNGYSGRTGTGGGGGGQTTRASGGMGKIIGIIIAVVAVLAGGGGLSLSGVLNNFLGGGTQTTTDTSALTSLLSGFTSSNVSTGWTDSGSNNTVKPVNTSVAKGAREKYTVIKGGGKDVVTLMVYMCGTDLESKYAMASKDMQEMAAASLSDKVNIIIYTGGCSQWQTKGISNTVSQIYKIENGGLRQLVADDGKKAMTDPATLTSFIKYCSENYPANRYDLIMWDHGGGTTGGFGYDQLFSNKGAMGIASINTALKNAGVKFDFVGFDACLMATAENALMLTSHADYLIASEETEPGVGWYYTRWLTELSKNTSLPTTTVGQMIVDDFVDTCNKQCKGQKTTLSLIDLAELQETVPESLNEFAKSTTALIKADDYQVVSNARSNTREFATSSKRDLVDLVHLAQNMNTKEGKALADVILSAVKYNRTSSEMTNSYGMSIYFPYNSTNKVDTAVSQYNAIGMDGDYAECIRQFAAVESAGQQVSAANGGSSSPISSLLGSFVSSGTQSTDMISSLLGSFLGGSSARDSEYLQVLDSGAAASYIAGHQFDTSNLRWKISGGKKVMALDVEQWKLVNDLELNVFIDDGEGFIDLGLDPVFEFDEDGSLVGEYEGTWMAINNQIVASYHVDTTYINSGNYRFTYRIPVMLNGQRADLIAVFDNETPDGYVAGARIDYRNGETEAEAKLTQLQDGDVIDFLCDYYKYDGTYSDSYMFGERLTVDGALFVSDVYLPAGTKTSAVYRFTDIYVQTYWTPEM